MGSKASNEFKQTKNQIDHLIKKMHSADSPWFEIASALARQNFKTPSGKPWTRNNIAGYAIRNGIVGRRINRGPNKAKRTYKTRTTSAPGISLRDAEDILTSTLSTELKIRVIKSLDF